MKILLTGFNPFGDLSFNPTQSIIEALSARSPDLPEWQLVTEVLPTEYGRAGQRLQTLITTAKPDIYLGLGVAVQRQTIDLERVALNLNDASRADNAGVRYQDQRIVADGPLAYFSNWPLVQLRDQLQAEGMDVAISNHAGTYVCNHVFYWAQHQVDRFQLNTLCGFMHVPGVALPTDQGASDLTLAQVSRVVERCLTLVVEWTHRQQP